MVQGFQHNSLKDDVASFIKERILRGEICPGERVNEAEIAKMIGVSRGPVREALRQLESEGLVYHTVNKGCTVVELSPERVSEYNLIRCALETLAVRVYSGVLEAGEIAALFHTSLAIEEAKRQGDLVKSIKLDQEFHASIVRKSGLQDLYKAWAQFDIGNVALFYATKGTPIMTENHEHSHADIVAAFREGELCGILQAIQGHYQYAPSRLYSKSEPVHDGIMRTFERARLG